ncbi:hypothetical protein Acr_15g0017990 [Actinidia rufa]|uniref:Peroxidase n=1 Tax=Actinidia rufa TaxID=165716 RepID=A0A7J0FWW2_9ERIC|nr:hypothetical protein Acr_15g0017990 [Actinidia rufa]
MDTRGKSNTEFRSEVSEVLARHESSFDQIHATLQTILTDLQALKAQTNISTTGDVNPFAVGIVPTQRVQLASFHLEGIALQWHRWFAKFKGPVNWTEFTTALLCRFGPTEYENPSEALTRLKHTTTVSAYQEKFEKLSQLIDALPDSHLIGIFIAGLKDEVCLDLKLTNPHTLSEAIGVARLVEERNSLQKKPTAGLLGPQPHLKNIPVAEISPPPFKRITDQEAHIRQEKGFEVTDEIKSDLEKKCKGVVSCADVLALETRDGIALTGGSAYGPTDRAKRPDGFQYRTVEQGFNISTDPKVFMTPQKTTPFTLQEEEALHLDQQLAFSDLARRIASDYANRQKCHGIEWYGLGEPANNLTPGKARSARRGGRSRPPVAYQERPGGQESSGSARWVGRKT